jgi:DUF2075 family protein
MFDDLNDGNGLFYAIKAYDRLNYIKSEFTEDYKTFRYIKRLIQRYRTNGELRENLILNHINILYNAFGVDAGTRLLFLKLDEEDYSSVKTFLLFLNTMPLIVRGINGEDIYSSDIPIDLYIADVLRKL